MAGMRDFSLPPLTGRIGTLARLAYAVLAAITAVIVIGSLVFNGLDFFRNLPADLQWGFRTFSPEHAGQPPFVGDVTPQAAARGLRPGDVPLAINGRPLPALPTEYVIGHRTAAATGESLTLRVRHADGSVASIVLPRNDHAWTTRELTSGLPLWLSSLGNFIGIELIPVFLLGASLLLALRRPHDSEAMLFAAGFLLLCNVSQSDFWLLALLGIPTVAMGLAQAAGQCLVIVAAAGFPGGRYNDPWSRAALILAVPLSAMSFWLREVQTVPVYGELVAASLLLALSGFAAIGIGRRYRRLPPGPTRQQVLWVAFGFCVSAIATVAYLRLVGELVTGNIPYFVFFLLLQMFAFISLPLGLLVSLLRYRLYDAERAISHSAVYAVLTCALVVSFAATEKLIELAGPEFLGGAEGAVAGALAAGFAAVLIAPLHHRIEDWAKRRFQRHLIRLRESLPLLAGDLREVAGFDELATALLKRIGEGLPASWLALVFAGEPVATQGIEREAVTAWFGEAGAPPERIDRADPVFPLRQPLLDHTDRLVGYLLLGPRPDNSFYGTDELNLLRDVSGDLARALLVCRQREAMDRAAAEQMTDFTTRLERLEQLVAGGAPQPRRRTPRKTASPPPAPAAS